MSGLTTSERLRDHDAPVGERLQRQLRSKEVVVPAAISVVVVVAWEFGVPAAGIEPYLLPTPSLVVAAFLANQGTILAALAITLREFAIGFGATVVTGYLIAAAMFEWTVMEVAVYPYTIVVRSIPTVALLPIFIVWFGFGSRTVLVVCYLISFFPMVVNTLSGFKATDDEVVDMLASFDAGRRDVYRHVYVYASLPTVFAGLKICVVLAFTGAIVGEFLVASAGIGALILEFNSSFETAAMFASIFAVTVTELLAFGAVVALERLVVDWA